MNNSRPSLLYYATGNKTRHKDNILYSRQHNAAAVMRSRVSRMLLSTLLCQVAFFLASSLAMSRDDEIALHRDLFANYSSKVRPQYNLSETLDVTIKYHIQSIFEMDEREQTLTTSGYVSIRWRDETLVWDPERYGGVRDILIKQSEIWLPDIVVMNGVNGFAHAGNLEYLVALYSDGMIDWTPGAVYQTFCPVDVTRYPFDTQTCPIVFTTWMHNREKVNLSFEDEPVAKGIYWESGEWEFAGAAKKVSSTYYGDFDASFLLLHLMLTLKRRRSFYVLNVLLPVVCLSMLNVLVFLLPPESGEKMQLSITILLSYAVFLSMISDNMPGTSNSVSFLAVYLVVVLFLAVLAAFISALLIWLYYRNGSQLEKVDKTTATALMQGKPSSTDMEMHPTGRYLVLVRKIDRFSFWTFLVVTLLVNILLVILLVA